MFLHEQHARTLWIHRHVVNAVPNFSLGIGNVLRTQSLIDGLPRIAPVISTKSARRRNGDEHALRIARVQNDGVQTHAARARLPLGAGAMASQSREFLPVLSTVGRAEQGGVFHSSVNGIKFG